MIEPYIINQKQGKVPEILIYGQIGNWAETDTKQFISDFKKLEQANPVINVRLNSLGGELFSGLNIYTTLKESKSIVNTFIDGVAASMASVIALAGTRVHMSRYAQLMIHKVSGSVPQCDSDKLRETADLMDDLENSLVEIYSEKTGLTNEEVKTKWMQRGQETWFTAKEALENKLIDEIYNGEVKKKAPDKISANQKWKFYNEKFLTIYNKHTQMENLTEFISFFNLKNDAGIQEILASIQSQANENKNLKNEIEQLKEENGKYQKQIAEENKSKIQNLITSAIKEKKITESQKSVYMTLAEANFNATQTALESIIPYKSITEQLKEEIYLEDELKTFVDYQKKAPQVLAEMKTKNPEKYSLLFERQYGSKPKLN